MIVLDCVSLPSLSLRTRILWGIVTPGPRVRPAAGLWHESRYWDGMAFYVTTCPTMIPATEA